MSIVADKMKGKKCNSCGFLMVDPAVNCTSCGSADTSETEFSGKGTIYTYSIVHYGFGHMASRAPYALVILELEDGIRVTGILEPGTDLEKVAIGAAVEFAGHEEPIGLIFRLL